MKAKKSPQRMCVACREMHDKRDMIRVVRSPEGEISLDFTGRKNGRGAYLCKSRECILKCRKTGALSRAFSTQVEPEVYDKLLEEFDDGDNE